MQSVFEINLVGLEEVVVGGRRDVEGRGLAEDEALPAVATHLLMRRAIVILDLLVKFRLELLYFGELINHASNVARLRCRCHVPVPQRAPHLLPDPLRLVLVLQIVVHLLVEVGPVVFNGNVILCGSNVSRHNSEIEVP